MERREIKENLDNNQKEIDNLWRRLWRSKKEGRNRKTTKGNRESWFLEWQRKCWKGN